MTQRKTIYIPMYRVPVLVYILPTFPYQNHIKPNIFPQVKPTSFDWYVVHASEKDVAGFVSVVGSESVPDMHIKPTSFAIKVELTLTHSPDRK
jgi:hypothetical protein